MRGNFKAKRYKKMQIKGKKAYKKGQNAVKSVLPLKIKKELFYKFFNPSLFAERNFAVDCANCKTNQNDIVL